MLKNQFNKDLVRRKILILYKGDKNLYDGICTKLKKKGVPGVEPNFLFSSQNLIYSFNKPIFFSKFLNKFYKVHQQKGKKHLSYKFIHKTLYLNKNFYLIENQLILNYVIQLFQLPIEIQKKKRGRKTLLNPRFFDINKVDFKVVLNLMHSVREKNLTQKSFLSYLVCEFFFLLKKDSLNSDLAKFYQNLLKTVIDNRSWMNLK